ncbi:polymorphic outer membrane protein repeat-containing protein [Parelusimicrobium proximum]|uniref:autotransporter domain-containing protein n=1 Tax=Parelusimicrobium proximum TaxID=3228953 RepID=UPI003D16B445
MYNVKCILFFKVFLRQKKLFFLFIFLLSLINPLFAVPAANHAQISSAISAIPSGGTGSIDITVDEIDPFSSLLTINNRTVTVTSSAPSGETVLKGNNASSFFNIYTGANVDFTDISFEEGYRASGAGAINMNGSQASFNGTTNFKNNSTGTTGGVIVINSASSVTFNGDTVFDSNSAATSAGAISNSGSATFNGETQFLNNSSGNYGGALLLSNGSVNTFNDKVTFDSNQAAKRGGAVWTTLTTVLDFKGDAEFTNNISGEYGGGLFIDQGTVTFEKSAVFRDNTATANRGGGIYMNNGTINFQGGGTFSGNTDFQGANDITLGGVNGATMNVSGTEDITFASGIKSTTALSAVNNTGSGKFTAEMSQFMGTFTQDSNASANSVIKGAAHASSVYNIKTGTADFEDSFGAVLNISSGAESVFSGLGKTLTGTISNSGTLGITGSITNAAALTGNGNYTVSAGGSFTNNNTISGNGNHTVAGTFLNNGAVTGTGTTTVSGIYTNNTGKKLTQSGLVVQNSGILTTDGEDLIIGAGGIDVEAGGTLKIDKGVLNMTGGDLSLKGAGAELDLYNPQFHSSTAVVSANIQNLNTATDSLVKMNVFSNGNNDVINASGAAQMDGKLEVLAGVGTYNNVTFTLVNAGSLAGDLLTDIGTGTPSLATLTGLGNISGMYVTYTFNADSNTIKITISGTSTSSFASLNGMSFNQSEIAGVFDDLSGTAGADLANVINAVLAAADVQVQRAALGEISPYFLANVLRADLNSGYRNSLYARIKNYCPACSNNGVWLEGDGWQRVLGADSNSVKDFTASAAGFRFGADRFFKESDLMLGLYGEYTPVDMKQNGSKAEADYIGGGIYGGLIEDKWDFKALLGIGISSYDVKRRIYEPVTLIDRRADSSFDAFNMAADFEAGYKIPLNTYAQLKPYGGIGMAMLMYQGFTERGADSLNQRVEGDMHIASAARLGAAVSGGAGRLGWRGGAEYSFTLTGYDSEIESSFDGTNAGIKTRGATSGRHIIGLNAGVDYNLTKNLNIYLDGDFRAGGDYSNIYGALGLRYAFCGGGKKLPAPAAAAPAAERAPAAEPEKEIIAAEPEEQPEPATADPAPAVSITAPKKIATATYMFDKADLTAASKAKLDKAYEEVKDDNSALLIVGHTDSTGPEAYNQKLSERRAKAAYDYLKSLGIEEHRIAYTGKGESEPAADNATRAGRAANRRIEVVVF